MVLPKGEGVVTFVLRSQIPLAMLVGDDLDEFQEILGYLFGSIVGVVAVVALFVVARSYLNSRKERDKEELRAVASRYAALERKVRNAVNATK
jgi:hypothetical protein